MEKISLSAPLVWTGNLNDDCSACWNGLLLRAEHMSNRIGWWWRVYFPDGNVVDSSIFPHRFGSGSESRKAAEKVARNYVAKRLVRFKKVKR